MPLLNYELEDEVKVEIVCQGWYDPRVGWVDCFGYPVLIP